MIQRLIQSHLESSLSNFPAVYVTGPRGTGRSTLVKTFIKDYQDSIYIDLENPSNIDQLINPEDFLHFHEDKLVLIDSIERMPELITTLSKSIYENSSPGRYLLVGSSSRKLKKTISELLASHVEMIELSPFNLLEVEGNLNHHWWRGGFPESYLASDQNIARQRLNSIIQTFIERDLPLQGIHAPYIKMIRFIQMLAHSHGNILNASKLARSMDVSVPTVIHYLDLLEDSMIIRRLRPWYANVNKRLVKSPKVYIRDSGILHTLLNILEFDDLFSHPELSLSWEGYVIEQIDSILPENYNLYFYKTHKGAEIDLIITRGMEIFQVIQIKQSNEPFLSRRFYSAWDDLGNPPVVVVYPGKEGYPLEKDIEVLPLFDLLNIYEAFLFSK